jgi:O-antigen/teichoic acid export membrane protein
MGAGAVNERGSVRVQERAAETDSVSVQPGAHKVADDNADLVSIARQFGAVLMSSIASGILGFAVTLLITRTYGATGAGMIFVSMAVFQICLVVVSSGADLGGMRTIARQLALGEPAAVPTTIRAALAPVAAVATFAAIVLFILTPDLAPHFVGSGSSEDVISLFRVVILFLPFAAVSLVAISTTRGFGTMTPYIVSEQFGKPLLIASGVGITAGMFPTEITLTGLAWASPNVVAMAYAIAMLRRLAGGLPAGPPLTRAARRAIWREFWRFASVRAVASVSQVLIHWLDVILVAALASPRDAGIYAAVSRVIVIGAVAQRAIIRVMAPRFSGLLAVDNRSRVQDLYQTVTAWLIAMSSPFYLSIIAFAPGIVLIFGSGFTAGALPMEILAAAALINIATGPATTILLMAGKASWNLGNSAGSLTINTVLNIALIPLFGITGAAIAWSVSVVFQNLLPTWQIYHSFHLHPFSLGTLTTGGAALLVFGFVGILIEVIWNPPLVGVMVIGICLTGIYLAILWYFRRLIALDAVYASLRFRARAA